VRVTRWLLDGEHDGGPGFKELDYPVISCDFTDMGCTEGCAEVVLLPGPLDSVAQGLAILFWETGRRARPQMTRMARIGQEFFAARAVPFDAQKRGAAA